MATRMQQRRGTAAQWTAADPILASGEIGFETDTTKFKIGDGVNHWAQLTYYVSADGIADLVDGAPELLNTLNELAAAIGDDPTFISTVTNGLASKLDLDGGIMTGDLTLSGAPTSNLHAATKAYVDAEITSQQNYTDSEISAQETYTDNAAYNERLYAANQLSLHSSDTTNIHGIADTTALATKTYADGVASDAQDAAALDAASQVSAHANDTTSVHGIADTSVLETISGSQDKADAAEQNAITTAADAANTALGAHASDTTDVHGIADTSLLATTTDVSNAQSDAETFATDAISTHNLDTTSVHGIADTSALATKTYADNAVSTHSSDTTDVHGISDTSALATKTYADNAVSTHNSNTTTAHGVTGAVVGTTNTQTLTNKTLTSPVINSPTGIVKADVGLGNVNNTSDADKPVSTATQAALDLKANLAGPTFTGTTTTAALTVTGNLTVNGTTTTVTSQNLEVTDPLIYIGTGNTANSKDLGVVGHFDNGTYQHTGIVRDATDGKWKVFSGVTTEPSDTIDFATYTKDTVVLGALEADSATIGNVSNTELQYLDGVTSAIQTQINAKAPSSSPTLATPTITGALTLSASGVVFTDGTQTKEGVPSRTPIIAKTASYTLSALSERDSIVEMNSASAVTLTIPTNTAVAYPVGTSIDVLATGAGAVTIAGDTGVTVNATPGLILRTQWSACTLFKRDTNTWVVYGDLKA